MKNEKIQIKDIDFEPWDFMMSQRRPTWYDKDGHRVPQSSDDSAYVRDTRDITMVGVLDKEKIEIRAVRYRKFTSGFRPELVSDSFKIVAIYLGGGPIGNGSINADELFKEFKIYASH